jgi:hypothetical protein
MATPRWCGLSKPTTPADCGVLLFMHIPKTGGTTVSDFLLKTGASHGWTWRAIHDVGGNPVDPRLGMVGVTHNATPIVHHAPSGVREHSSWDRVMTECRVLRKPRFVVEQHIWAGHGSSFAGNLYSRVLNPLNTTLSQKACSLKLATVLREPVARTRSHASELHLNHSAYAAFATTAGSNTQTYFLLHNAYQDNGVAPRISPAHAARAHELLTSSFDLVGRLEELDAFLDAVAALLGWAKPPPRHETLNQRPPSFSLSEAEVQLTHAANALDSQLYNSFLSTGGRCRSR